MSGAEWSVMIADDEPAARRGVRQLLAAFPEFRVAAECRNGLEVLAQLDAARPDVVFLDVQMPGLDGFGVIRMRSPERMPAVVFLTAYDEFAVKAFEAQALDYLVKPVTAARFAATMHRLTKQLSGRDVRPSAPTIAVATSRGTLVFTPSEIEWIEAADNYSRIWVGERSYLLRESLNALESRIGAQGFVRAHRQALVRTAAVRKLLRSGDDDLVAVLASGRRVRVARRRRAELMKAVRGMR